MITDTFVNGFIASLIAGMITGIGGLCIFLKKRYLKSDINQLLNLAAGVMLAASFFSLLVPSMQDIVGNGKDLYADAFGYTVAVFMGVLLVWVLNLMLPHEHNAMGHHGPSSSIGIKKAWLFIIAITLHKLPEGLAVGVAYGAESLVNPLSLVIGIAAHNVPEGLTIAISLIGAGYSKLKAAIVAFVIGFMQPIGAIVGLLLMDISFNIVPYGMALAGGTLLFVVINEILPETYGQKETNKSAAAIFLGFILMTYVTMIFH
ncbi:MAG: ZIP family metal transporter [Alphaproteobacteria bacterium]|nr:ZIP family metal transporter [Alphaproteobacteria bacterium]